MRKRALRLCQSLVVATAMISAPALAQTDEGEQGVRRGASEMPEVDLTKDQLEEMTGICTRAVSTLTSGSAPPAALKHNVTDAHVSLFLEVLFDSGVADDAWVEELSQRLNRRIESGDLEPIRVNEPGGTYRPSGVTLNLSTDDQTAYALCEFRQYENTAEGALPVFARVRLARTEKALFSDWVGVPML